MISTMNYVCIEEACCRCTLTQQMDGLRCRNGHFYPFLAGTSIPVFIADATYSEEYARIDAGSVHDNSLAWLFKTFNAREEDVRNALITRLRLLPKQSVLITGAGTGNDLPHLAKALDGEGVIYAQDISPHMLSEAQARHGHLATDKLHLFFSLSDATRLPFPDNAFDAAYHFGGINLFPSIKQGIAEMSRVVRPSGRIVFGDEGVAPWLKDLDYGKMLIRNNPLDAFEPPLALLPETADEVCLSWILGNSFYVVDYTVSETGPFIDIDVPHVGTRGGSLRKRYHGQLEGVDPILKDKLYGKAFQLGVSRVDLLENILSTALEKEE